MRSLLESISKRFFLLATMMLMVVVFTAMPVQAAEFSFEKFATDNAIWFGLFFVIIEYILGKTTLVKSGSTLELVINTVVGLLKKFFGPSTPVLKG